MPPKKYKRATEGAIGGYLRVSMIAFPPECRAPDERLAHVEMLRQIRKAELCRDAAQQGETITEWYDDLGISGRGEFIARRTAFAKLRQDAAEGRLRSIYARDLSRLFRNVVQQELWFVEMEKLGVTVHAQDLPFSADAPTRLLLRQQMGIIHEYVSNRMGSMHRDRVRTRILAGQGMGLSGSQWGLRYDAACKVFEYDPETADHVRLLYETYVACNGVAFKTAAELNRMLAHGHPRATPTPQGKLWTSTLALNLLRRQTYRRIIKYGDLLVPSPERIPEVVPPELIARVDALLLPRREYYEGIQASRLPGRLPETYAGLIRCGYCGAATFSTLNNRHCDTVQQSPNFSPKPKDSQSKDSQSKEKGPDDGEQKYIRPEWVSYRCKAATGSTRSGSSNLGCYACYSVQQFRLHALIGEGLEHAFQSFFALIEESGTAREMGIETDLEQEVHTPDDVNSEEQGVNSEKQAATPDALSPSVQSALPAHSNSAPCNSTQQTASQQTTSPPQVPRQPIIAASAACIARQEVLLNLARKRARYLEMFACGVIHDMEELQRHLQQVDQERQMLEYPRVNHRPLSTASLSLASREAVAQYYAQFVEVWPANWHQVHDPSKRNLLQSLRVAISIRVLPREAKVPSRTGHHRNFGGRLTLTLEIPALGFVGQNALQLAETNMQFNDYWKWRLETATKNAQLKNKKP